jgi:hypothetical protein
VKDAPGCGDRGGEGLAGWPVIGEVLNSRHHDDGGGTPRKVVDEGAEAGSLRSLDGGEKVIAVDLAKVEGVGVGVGFDLSRPLVVPHAVRIM